MAQVTKKAAPAKPRPRNARPQNRRRGPRRGPAARSKRRIQLGLYRDMLMIRRFEERAGQLYGMGLIGGFCHLYIGQEAIAVGMQRIKVPGDQVITGYRDHVHMLACGMDPRVEMAELTGRAAGAAQGKGGSMAGVPAQRGLLLRPRHRRRPGVAGYRAGPGHQISQQRQCRLLIFRRRRGQPGSGLRELQHGRTLASAGGLCDREQPVRHGHQRRTLVLGNPSLQARGHRFNIPGVSRWMAWISSPSATPA